MINGLGLAKNSQPLYGTNQTLAAGSSNNSALKLTIQDTSLLNFLARCPHEFRVENYPKIKDQFEDGSFAQQVALLLLRQHKSPVDPLIKDCAIWLLENCGINDEAKQLRKA